MSVIELKVRNSATSSAGAILRKSVVSILPSLVMREETDDSNWSILRVSGLPYN